MSRSGDQPLVSVVVPCRNEIDAIGAFLDGVLEQRVPSHEVEIVVADGMSDDGTRAVLERFRRFDPRLRVIENPRRIVSSGLNLAVGASAGGIIVRMDVHTDYAQDYLARCVEALEKTGADCVGGPWVAEGTDYVSSAVALGFGNPFVSGGGRVRRAAYEGPVDTVYLGCWRREVFARFGAFDEELVRNQDDEFNLRVLRRGGRVWQTPRIRSRYRPRSSLRWLFRQQRQYGYWKVRVIQKHRLPASVRHLVPATFLVWLMGLAVAAPFWSLARLGLAGTLLLYGVGIALATAASCARPGKIRYLPLLPLVMTAFHVGYGYGFLRGIWDFVVRRKGHTAAFATLTRDSRVDGSLHRTVENGD